MSTKLISATVLAGILLAVAAPAPSFAAAPKTKADCEKAKGMKWDDATSKCVKK